MKKKLTAIIISIILLLIMLSGCSNGKDNETDNDGTSTGAKDQLYGIVFKNTGNPFGEQQILGFEEAIDELGAKSVSKAPDKPTAELQITAIQELIDQGSMGIAIAANDESALSPVLKSAESQDISVVSYDSAVTPDSRDIHINQADIKGVAKVLAESVYDMTGGEGDYAILSATSTATNQNAWIEAMQKYMEEDSKYSNINLVKIAYGDDLRDKSTEETEAILQSYPNVKVILAPSTVALSASAKVVTDKNLGDKVKVTGLGLPSEMAEYINNGVTPYMYLWNPIDTGYLTGQALYAIANDKLEVKEGATFNAGRLGEKKITKAEDGGLEIILGEPFRFDPSNIDEWKDKF